MNDGESNYEPCRTPGWWNHSSSFSTTSSKPETHHKGPRSWYANCQAVRLTCKRFAALEAPIAALFHSVTVSTTIGNLARLQVITSHPTYRKQIQRIYFRCPFLDHRLLEYEFYAWTFAHERCLAISKREAKVQARAGFRAYKQHYTQQRKGLRNGSFCDVWTSMLSPIPFVKHVQIEGPLDLLESIPHQVYHELGAVLSMELFYHPVSIPIFPTAPAKAAKTCSSVAFSVRLPAIEWPSTHCIYSSSLAVAFACRHCRIWDGKKK